MQRRSAQLCAACWSQKRSCAFAVSALKILREECSAPIDLVYVFVLEHPQTGKAMYLLDDSASDDTIITDFACDALATSPKLHINNLLPISQCMSLSN